MKIKLKKYKVQLEEWPPDGHHIMAQYDDEKIIVYISLTEKKLVNLQFRISILEEHSV